MAPETLRTLEQRFLAAAAKALGRPTAAGLRLCDPPSSEVGDVAIGFHGVAKEMATDPQTLALQVAAALGGDPFFREARADNGYCNVRFDRARLFDAVAGEVAAGERFGADATIQPEQWLIEYSGPNTNKPLHIGHLRNTILGFAMANIVQLHGHRVIRYNIVNDRGIHICKSMVAYRRFGAGVTPQSSGEKGDQLVGRLYSLFTKKAAEEFEEWAKGPGQKEIDAFLLAKAAEIAAGADLPMRKRFLLEQEKAGRALSFKPNKIKPQLYPEKMQAEPALEVAYQEWLTLHAAEAAETRRTEGLKRAQAVVARRFEAEVSKLHEETRDYLRRWEAADPEIRALWRMMNDWVLAGIGLTYQRLGVHFDHVDYESDVYLLGKEIVGELLAKGVATKKADGAVVFVPPDKKGSVGAEAQEKVLLRADGTSVYITQDLGSLTRRYQRHHPDQMVWVVGSEQELHFETLFALVDALIPGLGARCRHLSYGMVELPHGKMKSREGEIVEADGFLDMVHDAAVAQGTSRSPELAAEEIERRSEVLSLAAVKFNLLKFNKRSTVKFDVEEALDMNGKTGPYCLYALARIRSILRRIAATGASIDLAPKADAARLALPEAALLVTVARFPQAVATAVRDLEPYHVTDFVYRLAKEFNSYYTATSPDGKTLYPVVQCEDPATRVLRVSLLRMIETALENGLRMLGIRTLQEM